MMRSRPIVVVGIVTLLAVAVWVARGPAAAPGTRPPAPPRPAAATRERQGFEDGRRPPGLRFCVTSESLSFTPSSKLATLADPAAEPASATTAPATTRPSATP